MSVTLMLGVAGKPAGAGHPFLERRHAGRRLQRILGCDHPPHLVEHQKAERKHADMRMAVMGGIERAAQDADAKAGDRMPPADVRDDGQGLVCPAPRTTYL